MIITQNDDDDDDDMGKVTNKIQQSKVMFVEANLVVHWEVMSKTLTATQTLSLMMNVFDLDKKWEKTFSTVWLII